jgi:hypothetical protein
MAEIRAFICPFNPFFAEAKLWFLHRSNRE